MLPQFPKSKKALDGIWYELVFRAGFETGPLAASFPHRAQHEGTEAEVQTVNGKTQRIEFREMRAEVSVKHDGDRGLTFAEFCNKAKELGAQFGHGMSKAVIEEIESAVKTTGNEIVVERGHLEAEHFLAAIENSQVDFDQDGKPESAFYVGTALADELKKRAPEWENDDQLRTRVDEVLRQKREEFREREARRRLVD